MTYIAKEAPSSPAWEHSIYWLYFTYLILLCGLFPLVRLLGPIPLFVLGGLACIWSIYRKKLLNIPKSLTFFVTIGIIYIFLSYAHLFPSAWTQYYDSSQITRQSYYVFLIIPLVAASKLFWEKTINDSQQWKIFRYIVIWNAIVVPITMYIFLYDQLINLEQYQSWRESIIESPLDYYLYGLGNSEISIVIAAFFYSIHGTKPQRLMALSLTIVWMAWSGSGQLKVVAAYALVCALTPYYRLALLGLIFLVLALPITILVLDLVPIIDDPNLLHRLDLWSQALRGLSMSNYLGVGFGTETVSGLYNFLYSYNEDPDYSWQFTAGVHNAFLNIGFRMGIVGLISFMLFFFIALYPRKSFFEKVDRMRTFVYGVIFIALSVNVAIASPSYLIGISLWLGYLLSNPKYSLAHMHQTANL